MDLTPPLLNTAALSAADVNVGDELTMTLNLINPANQEIESVFFNGVDNRPNSNSTTSQLFFTIPVPAGGVVVTIDDISTITYKLKDGVIKEIPTSSPLSVSYNVNYRAPIATSASFSETDVEPGADLTLTVQFTNPDNSEVTEA